MSGAFKDPLDVRVLPHRTSLLTGVSCEQNCVFRALAYVACVKHYNIKSTRASNLRTNVHCTTTGSSLFNALKKYKLRRDPFAKRELDKRYRDDRRSRLQRESKIFFADRISHPSAEEKHNVKKKCNIIERQIYKDLINRQGDLYDAPRMTK